MGAESNFLESVIGRVTTSLKSGNSEEEVVHQTIANSFLVSSDMVSELVKCRRALLILSGRVMLCMYAD